MGVKNVTDGPTNGPTDKVFLGVGLVILERKDQKTLKVCLITVLKC